MSTVTPFGIISAPSTSSQVTIVAYANNGETQPVIGHLAYFDTLVAGVAYRAVGTITDITTENAMAGEPAIKISASKGATTLNNSNDFRTTTLTIQSVFSYDTNKDEWVQYASALPNSPSTSTPVRLLTEDTVFDMLKSTSYPSIGTFRGLNAPAPLRLTDFASSAGAFHSAMVGKSGSGKSSTATFVLAAKMRHETHGIIVIDPQGQWNNENGFLFSVQAFARGLGRDVKTLRVAEDIRLPRNEKTLTSIINRVDLWSKFRRMGDENKEALSTEVSERLLRVKNFNQAPRVLLEKAFTEIALSDAAMRRIYASEDRRKDLQEMLRLLAGLPPLPDKADNVREVEAEEEEDLENMWEVMLSRFTPIHSLFSNTNLSGNPRHSLGGDTGFLREVLQVRNPDNPGTPAPYVVLDMSPDVKLNIKASLDENNTQFQMKQILDNEDVKSIIVLSVLEEIKKASEEAFAASGGNLNTEIVFDEAWRYAPEHSESEEISALSDALAGYARDTRKFGIGWRYILQSPADLRKDIWKQLSFTYSGYGLVGDDVKQLEALTDDPEQVRKLYRQFIPPTSTGIYPFMITGPESPLIFTSSPTFVNVFSSVDEFLTCNTEWIEQVTQRNHLPALSASKLVVGKKVRKSGVEKTVTKTYGVGKTTKKPDTQTSPKPSTPVVSNPGSGVDADGAVTPFPF